MPNGRTDTLMETYKPEVAVVVYKSSHQSYYLESHDINEGGQLAEGKPLLQETIQGMVDVFFDERRNTARFKGIIPDNLISFEVLPGGNFKLIWYRPAEIRVMHFATQLKLSTGKTWVPAMLYVADKRGLDVYALKANSRPKENTKLFRAPFHNVSDNGDVCLGSAQVTKPKQLTFESTMKYWEDLFWLSEFSHGNGGDKPVKSGELGPVWRKLLASKTKLKWSDLDELVELKKATLKNLLQ